MNCGLASKVIPDRSFAEETEELLNSELREYVYMFKYDDRDSDKFGKSIPKYIKIIQDILKNYDQVQININNKNPQKLLKEKYNFDLNTINLIK